MNKTGILASAFLIIVTTGGVVAHRNANQLIKSTFAPNHPITTNEATPDPTAETRNYKVKLGNDKNNQVRIEVYRSDVEVMGHNADEVVIETENFEMPERAAGLQSLYSEAVDNTNLGLAVNKENNTVHIVQANRRGGKYIIKVPKNVAVIYHEASVHGGKFNLQDTQGEIDLDLFHSSATLTNVTGPVRASTLHGHLDIKFSELNQAKSSSIKAVHGPVDITLPGNTKADFELASNHGEIYTDFAISQPSDSKNGLTKIAGGHTIKGKTNNGGVEMSISAVHSNIFIRKQK